MADERTTENRVSTNILHSENRDADPHHSSTQHARTDEKLLTTPEKQARRQQPEQQRKHPNILPFLLLTFIFIIVGSTLYLNRTYTVYEVQGTSMLPTLHPKDTVILRKTTQIHKGNIIVFHRPTRWEHTNGEGDLLIKRVAAVPGDTVTLNKTGLYINNEKLSEELPKNYICPATKKPYHHILHQGEFFVLGDNVDVSVDSRRQLCIGLKDASFIPYSSTVAHGEIAAKF